MYSSFFDCFSKIVKREGPMGLFKGLLSPLLGEIGNLAVLFGVYGNLKKLLPEKEYPKLSTVASSILAGVCVSFIVTPVELIKIRCQVEDKTNKSFLEAIRELLVRGGGESSRLRGIRAVYQGFCATLLRELPFNSVYFLMYYLGKESYAHHFGSLSSTGYLLAGGLAGSCAWAVCYPTDVIKSIVQASPNPIRIMDVVKKVRQEQGLHKGLYKGFTVTVLRGFPVNAVTFLVYEYVLSITNYFTQHYIAL